MYQSSKNIFIILLVTSIVSWPFASSAIFGEGDTSFDPGVTATTGAGLAPTGTTASSQVLQQLKSFALDGLAYGIAQKLSQKLVAMTLNAVNGGASKDKPANFIENFGKYFSDIAGKELSNYTAQLENSSNPYSRMIGQGMSNTTAGLSGGGLESFSLDRMLPKNVTLGDVSGDIGKAGNKGWDFYSQLSLGQNTPVGAAMIAQSEVSGKISAAKEAAKMELTSAGFTPQKGKDAINSALNQASLRAQKGIHNSLVTSKSRTEKAKQIDLQMEQDLNGDMSGGAGGQIGGCDPEMGCPQITEDYSSVQGDKKIKTPQGSVGGNATKATQEAGERLKYADQFFKLIFSTLTQIASGLIDKGISSLTSDQGASNPNQYGSPSGVAAIIGNGNRTWNKLPEEIIDFRNELEDAMLKTSLDVVYTSELLKVLRRPIIASVPNNLEIRVPTDRDRDDIGTKQVLQKLEQCIPGPDTGAVARMEAMISNGVRATRQAASADEKAKGELNGQALQIITSEGSMAVQNMQLAMINPLLTLPGMIELQDITTGYYKNAKQFQDSVTRLLLKKQTSSRVNIIVLQVQAQRDSVFTRNFLLKDMPEKNDADGDPIPKECPTGYARQGTSCNRTMIMPPMFGDEWDKISQADKEALYKTLSPDILAHFPEEYGELKP